MNPQSEQKVAAVCGNEVRMYGPSSGSNRPIIGVKHFSHHGAAVQFAQEYDELHKKK